ncbi:MAG TPA: helicase-related protein, partial [Bacteroidales bacterium]|nr:helicase-related protein [Bacteroidales bacterium]
MFNDLKRVQVINKYKPEGWSFDEIAGLSIEQAQKTNNCLVVVNTKKSAKVLFETIEINESTLPVYHLSTSMCPAHRLKILEEMKIKLQACETFICVSTQLIEAGVDIDFGTVIRFVAGIDSIVQAAGRCNRNGKREISRVFVVNPKDEIIDSLEDIKVGKEVCL